MSMNNESVSSAVVGEGVDAGAEMVTADPADRERWLSLDALPSAVAMVDRKGNVRWANAAWLRIAAERQEREVTVVGLSFNHVTGRVMGYDSNAAANARDGLRAVLAGSKPACEFEFACHPKGGEAWYALSITPCMVDGERGAMVQQTEVTDLKQNERRRSLNRAVARAMGREDSRREMLRDVITQVLTQMDWCVAARWAWDRASQSLRCDAVYSQRPDGNRGWGTLSNTQGLAARVWTTHCTQWSDGLDREDAAVVRTVLGGASEGVVEAVGVPVGRDGHADGVVVFYATHGHRPDTALMDMLSSLLVGGRYTPMAAAPTAPTAARSQRPASRDSISSVVDLAAASLCTVLVTGERGSGKARAAREIHLAGERARGPYVECDCTTLSPRDFDSTLFGVEAGVIPGSDRPRRGLFEQAAGGTLVFREVGALDPASQTKLLKVLEAHSYHRVGGTRELTPDVRVIATSARELRGAAHRKAFSEDLLQRLSSLVITVPSLRDRRAELGDVARAVLTDLARAYNRAAPTLDDEGLFALNTYEWPGNVRELRNVLERAWLGVGERVSHETLLTAITSLRDTAANDIAPPASPSRPAPRMEQRPAVAARPAAPAQTTQQVTTALLGAPDPLSVTLADVERAHIERVLVQTGFNMRRAAAALDISRSTLYLRAKHYKLNISRSRLGGHAEVENDNDADFELDQNDADIAATGT